MTGRSLFLTLRVCQPPDDEQRPQATKLAKSSEIRRLARSDASPHVGGAGLTAKITPLQDSPTSGPRPRMNAMSARGATLYVSGGVLEAVGILLIASPDLVPLLHRLWWYMCESPRRTKRWMSVQIRRLRRRPRPQQVKPLGIASEEDVALRLGQVNSQPRRD